MNSQNSAKGPDRFTSDPLAIESYARLVGTDYLASLAALSGLAWCLVMMIISEETAHVPTWIRVEAHTVRKRGHVELGLPMPPLAALRSLVAVGSLRIPPEALERARFELARVGHPVRDRT